MSFVELYLDIVIMCILLHLKGFVEFMRIDVMDEILQLKKEYNVSGRILKPLTVILVILTFPLMLLTIVVTERKG